MSNDRVSDIEKGCCRGHCDASSPRQVEAILSTKWPSAVPMALISFGIDFWLVGMYSCNVRNINSAAFAVPTLCLVGGICQTFTGWYELIFRQNTYAGIMFGVYGGFNLSYAGIFIPGFGVRATFASEDEFTQAFGIWLLVWGVMTFLFMVGSFRTSVAVVATLFFTTLTFVFLAIGCFTGNVGTRLAGGWFSTIAAWCGFWAAFAEWFQPATTYDFIRIPVFPLAPKPKSL